MSDRETRQITDSRVLAAMAHPLRRRLLDILRVDGPATASKLAERTEQGVGNISHHLRTLAACDLVAEAPELARDKRERWWRLVATTLRWSSSDFQDDSSAEAIAMASFSIDLDRQVGHVREFGAADAAERDWWAEGPFSTSHWMRLTADELEQVSQEVVELLSRWSNRELPDDGRERRTAFVFAHGVPARP
jgi:DNA-binding transcriptional ArsR family regulator